MAPVKLYGMTMSWNVTRCVAALEEAGVEYDVVPIDFGAGEHKTPEHLARNPFGQMPVLQDGDFYVWESRAICKYTCRKNKPELLKEGNLKESAMVDVWLEVEAHQYTAALEPIILECLVRPMFGRATDQKTVEDNLVKLKKVLEVYEARLSKCKYLAGDFLSLTDLNHRCHTHTHQQLSSSNTRLEPASGGERARTSSSSDLHQHFADRYDGESGVPAAALAGRVHQRIRRGVVRVQVGRERDGAAGDAGLRVRAGRGLRAGGHGRELPQPRLGGSALLLRGQQLLPEEQPDQGRHLRLRRHRHPLLRRPQCCRLGNLQVPCNRKCGWDEHRERHGDRLRRWHQLFSPRLDKPSYARHGGELHHADRQRVRPYGEHHRPREQRCSCRRGRLCWRPWPRRRCRGLRPRFLGAVLIMKQRET